MPDMSMLLQLSHNAHQRNPSSSDVFLSEKWPPEIPELNSSNIFLDSSSSTHLSMRPSRFSQPNYCCVRKYLVARNVNDFLLCLIR